MQPLLISSFSDGLTIDLNDITIAPRTHVSTHVTLRQWIETDGGRVGTENLQSVSIRLYA